jgi:hypothetical protein
MKELSIGFEGHLLAALKQNLSKGLYTIDRTKILDAEYQNSSSREKINCIACPQTIVLASKCIQYVVQNY